MEELQVNWACAALPVMPCGYKVIVAQWAPVKRLGPHCTLPDPVHDP